MRRTEEIARRLEEVLLNGKWIANTNFKEQVEHLSLKEAQLKVGQHNSIAALTFHVNYYVAGVLNVFIKGNLEISDHFSFDMPPLDSEKDWQELVQSFIINSERLVEEVKKMQEEKLEDVFVDENYGTWMRNIDGIIEHAYYHLGQVSLIKKLIAPR